MGSPLDNFALQAYACERLGSPFTGALCRAIPEAIGNSAFGKRITNWPAESAGQDALALRACGALNASVLTGRSPGLAAVYPPHGFDHSALVAAVAETICAHDIFLTAFLDSPPQTNEVGRSSMILGATLIVADETGLPLSIMEIGASAGLNLLFEHYRFALGEDRVWGLPDGVPTITSGWSGNVPPLAAPLAVVARMGCDRNPLDPADPADRLRLLSYVWPDQPQRLERMRQALDLAAQQALVVEKADAAAWVERMLEVPQQPGTVRMLYHTIVWQYLPEPTKTCISAAFEKAGAKATDAAPLAWFRFENDAGADGDGGLMELTLWPGGETRVLGRAHFHGGWVRWA